MAERSEEQNPSTGAEATGTPTQERQSLRSASQRPDDRRSRGPSPDGSTDRRRRRGGGGERRQGAGFGDEVERAFCAHFRHTMPQTFPVQHRHNLATRKAVMVARRDDMILYCDSVHSGGHAWPDGSLVDPDAGSG